jgi:hypothetical protein
VRNFVISRSCGSDRWLLEQRQTVD